MEDALTKIGIVIFMIAIVAVFLALPVMWLWNWLMPELFGLKELTFLQALGLNCLCSCLFKNSGFNSSKKE